MNKTTRNHETPHIGKYLGLLILGLLIVLFLLPLVGCAARLPIPPSGEQMGRYGWIEGRIAYVPNFQTAIDFFQPNGDVPTTLNDK